MRYARLIDGVPSFAPNPIHDGTFWRANPPGEVYLAHGYKPVEYTEHQGEAPEGYRWAERWSETETAILQSWEAVELPPEGDLDPAEAMDILLGGEAP